MSLLGSEAWQLLVSEFSLRWSIALLHFLWQGAVVGALVFVAARLSRSWSARTRYALHSMALLSLPVCLAVTFAALESPPSVRPSSLSSGATEFNAAQRNCEFTPTVATTSTFEGNSEGGGIPIVLENDIVKAEALTSDPTRAKPMAKPTDNLSPSLASVAPLLTGSYLAGVVSVLSSGRLVHQSKTECGARSMLRRSSDFVRMRPDALCRRFAENG